MRRVMILVSLLLEIHFHFVGSQAENQHHHHHHHRQKEDDGNDKGDEVIEGSIKEVLAQSGSTANLPCRITDPASGIITWIRRRDRQLLTVGTSTHSIDNRFSVLHSNTDWSLQIRTTTPQDAGIYECQIASHPVQRNFVRLNVAQAYSIIPGAPDLHVKQGSSLRLECQLMAAAESPLYVFWYRQNHMINYDEEPGVKVELTKRGSILTVKKTQTSHGGNYTCVPSNTKPAYVMVHVIEEDEKPAAMHGGGERRSLSTVTVPNNHLLTLLSTIVGSRISRFASLYPT